ncbi:MAG: ribulose-phosphate 3-epimerase [Candidatus Terrybacteria bacterium]|nr:ribulose-phosphate 3-epimerase [Candidatus Terrybacteria bacterium]
MVEIIPVILAKDFAEVVARVTALKDLAAWAQIDVVDGKFAPNTTWDDPAQLASLDTALRFEIDLMVVNPEQAVERWISAAPRVGRIYFHQETLESQAQGHRLITRIKSAGIEAGISLNPKTPIGALEPFVPTIDAVLCLGVEPGFGGQQFHEEIIEKVRALHTRHPALPIEVDGGVRVGVTQRLAEAGATRLAAGSAIFDFDAVPIAEELILLQNDANPHSS